jgi:hypothetical protein
MRVRPPSTANPLSKNGFSVDEPGGFGAEFDFFPVFSRAAGKTAASHRKVLGLGVVEDDGGGGLLGVELVFFAEGDADFLGAE